MSTELIVAENKPLSLYREATDVAGVCREIVLLTAKWIQGRRFVECTGWNAIARAHGCIPSSVDVQKVEGGYTAKGIIRRVSDGVILCEAEGFVGMDEKHWASQPEYACRAMAQTRAISRACRAAFAHVVVLIDSNLMTTPAEEVPANGFDDSQPAQSSRVQVVATTPRPAPAPRPEPAKAPSFEKVAPSNQPAAREHFDVIGKVSKVTTKTSGQGNISYGLRIQTDESSDGVWFNTSKREMGELALQLEGAYVSAKYYKSPYTDKQTGQLKVSNWLVDGTLEETLP